MSDSTQLDLFGSTDGHIVSVNAVQNVPFSDARVLKKRLKLFIWGDAGTGKSTLSLQFPKPVVIDMEGGTELYGGKFSFGVFRTSSADDAFQAVRWLSENPHQYQTLIIDPISVLWESLQKKWSDIFLRRNKNSKGYKFEFYEFQPRDWMAIKAELKDLIRLLTVLDMNVVVIARQKPLYSETGFMRAIGDTFDAEKSTPYLFDVVVQLFRDEKGGFRARCTKDRTNTLPKPEFECTYEVFETAFELKL